MDAPTEWTYGGLVDWTSENSLKLTPYEYALRLIIEAIKEKASAAKPYYGSFWDDIGTMYKSLLIESSSPLEFKAFNPLETFAEYAEDIHHIITKLIPKFINHTDSSGIWNSGDNCQEWSEASILNSIGATERIASSSYGNFDYNAVKLNPDTIRKWVYQNYLILNKLKWVKRQYSMGYWKKSYKYSAGGESYRQEPGSAPPGWADAESKFLSEVRGGLRDYGELNEQPYIRSYAGFKKEFEGDHHIWYYYTLLHRTVSVGVKNLPELYKSIDHYMYVKREWGYTTYSQIFDGQGNDFTEDKWNKVSEVSETSDSEIIFPWTTCETPTLPPNRPVNINVIKGYWAQNNILILKFDGENGFKFKNW